jgi:hypothetical protein
LSLKLPRQGLAPDAFFIQGITQTALGVWSPAALILDLRELSYTWGDDMDCVLGVGAERDLPTAVVGSGLCLPAMGTLIHGVDSTTPATDVEHIFDSIEEAWDYIHQTAKPR